MGSSQPDNVTQTNKIELSPEQKAVFNQALPFINAYGSSPAQIFPGSTVSGFNINDLLGQQGVLDQVGTGQQLAGQAAGANSKLMDLDFLLNPNKYVTGAADALVKQTTDNLMENILPTVRGGSQIAGGQYSGGQTKGAIAEGQAIGKTNTGLSAALADMYFKNYTTGLSTAGDAIARNPSVMQQQIMPALWQSTVGMQQRSMAQAQLDDEVQRFYAEQNKDFDKAKNIMALLGSMPGSTGVSTVQGAAPSGNAFTTGIGATMAILGLMSGNPMMMMQGASMGTGGMGK